MTPKRRGPDALKVELVPIDTLTPDPENARKHSRRNLDAIRRSLELFGQRKPIVITKAGVVLAGNGTLAAATDLGWETINVHRLPWRDLAKCRAYALTDNRTAELATWDERIVHEQVGQLAAHGFESTDLGWDAAELRKLGGDVQDVTTEDPPPISMGRSTRTRRGDLWRLGPHRLLCGDATKAADVRRLMGRELASLVFTDPPYGVDYDAPSGKHAKIANDDLTGDRLIKLLTAALKRAVAASTEAAAFYIWHASATHDEFSWAMRAAGLAELQTLIWVKPSPAHGWADYQWAHEPCFYAGKDGSTPAWYGGRATSTVWRVALRHSETSAATNIGRGVLLTDGDGHELHVTPAAPKGGRKLRTIRTSPEITVALHAPSAESTVWEVGRDVSDPDHPTQKPVELARRAIENSSAPGEIVLDPFLGSGSTLIAADITGRRGYGLELDPKYCDVIVDRWSELTGAKPERDRG